MKEVRNMKEVWEDIAGYEGLYQASNIGRIKSLRNNIILKQSYCRDGYLKVDLCKDKRKSIQVHTLIANTFVDGNSDGLQVNHIDGNKNNNNASNLEWVTGKENLIHAIKMGLLLVPDDWSVSTYDFRKIKQVDISSKEIVSVYDSTGSAAREINGDRSAIRKCCMGKRNTHRGYIWRYV